MDERLWAAPVVDAHPGLHDFFLGRLIAFAIRQAVTEHPDQRRMLGGAVFSTFLDSLDLGLAEQACKAIAFVRAEVEPVRRFDFDDVAT